MTKGINDLYAQAAEWALKASSNELADADARKLRNWLSEDDRHLGAYLRAMATLARLEKHRAAIKEWFDKNKSLPS